MTEKRIKLKKINNESLVGTGNITALTSHQDISGKLDIAQTSYKGKNVVVDSTTGNITFENKPTVPSASTTTPSADTSSGSYGSGTSYARSNHTHPKSSLYAEASHTHDQYLTEHQSLANYVTTDDSRLSDARTPTSHTHTKSQITDFPSIPSASSTTPSADTTNGSVGTGTTWARSNHTHPKSSLYAESSHTHDQYLTSHQDISGKENTSNKVSSWSSPTNNTNYPTEKLVKDSLDGKSDTGHEHDATEIWADYYVASGGYLNHITLDERLEEIENKIPSNNPVSDTETGLATILTYIDTNWEDY